MPTADYETTFVLKPTLTEDEIAAIVERVSQILSSGGATINRIDHWGRRRLSYEIAKLREGFYVFISFSMEKAADTISRLEQFYRLQENIIRYLTVIAPDARPRGRRRDKRAEKARALVEQKRAEGEAMSPASDADADGQPADNA
ncbi:MAG: hypothetical protein Kow0059_00870 [Candidatus Sumerlaeia bacterium]